MNNAEKQSFKSEIQKRIAAKLGEDFLVKITEVFKTNVSLDAVTIYNRNSSTNITPTIYLNSYYNDFSHGVAIEDIVEKIVEVYETHKKEEPVDVSKFMNFEIVKNRIACKIINRDLNQKLLEDVPFDEVLDMAIVFYVVFDMNEYGNASILIHNSHLDIWGISKEELSELAHKNTPEILGVSIQSMSEVMGAMLRADMQKNMSFEADDQTVEDMMEQMISGVDNNMYVLTNTHKLNGAVLMTYPEILREFAMQHQVEKVIVIPSSIHEALLLIGDSVMNMEFDYFNSMVQEVNDTTVNDDEILNNHCYLYTVSDNKLTMI